MKKATIAIISLGVLVVASVVAIIFYYQLPFSVKTKELTLEAASKEMPYISISAEETTFIQNLIQDSDVKAAIESGQTVGLPVEKVVELASGILPAEIKVDRFSMGDKIAYLEYYINDYRAMLSLRLTDNSITKSIMVDSKDGSHKPVYENFNNQTFKKHTLVRSFF